MRVIQESRYNLRLCLDWNILVGSLPLIYTKYNEYNGCWYHIVRNQFDLFMLEVGPKNKLYNS